MARPLPLTVQRQHERELYISLSERARDKGIGGLTMQEVVLIEKLHQKSLNEEFQPGVSEEDIVGLAAQRMEKAQKSVVKGEPPFEKTCFDRWRWGGDVRRYKWIPSDGQQPEPRDYRGGPFFWQPEGILPPGVGPEGNFQSRT